MRIKILIISFALTSILHSSYAQKNDNIINKITNKIFSTETSNSRKNSFIALPALSYAQETGVEFGIASVYNFYLDKSDNNNKTSNINLIGTVTTKKQKKINITSDIWTKNNEYHILTDIRFRDWPFNFYGIGNDTWAINENHLDQNLSRVKIDVEKKVASNLYIGTNVNYDNYKFKNIGEQGVFESSEITGKSGGQFLNFGISALYDSRDVTTYSNKGMYTRIKYSYAPNIFGKDNFIGSMAELDIRGYHLLNQKTTIAIQGLYRGTYGKNSPFYVLRDLGGDMTMRGYYLGRYKDNNYLTAQTEIRYRFHPRLGAVGFIGTGTTFSREQSPRFVPTYGFGGRYFFSLEHKTSIRLDYALGEKRPGEKRQSGFYLSLSEAF